MTTPDRDQLTTADLASATARPQAPVVDAHDGEREAVFTNEEIDQLRPQWNTIQSKFIDEPRKSVEEADHLVASTIKRLADSFASERAKLEARWVGGGDVSTEDLRLALRRYRSFFDRLLSA